jgi:hypothetical protein
MGGQTYTPQIQKPRPELNMMMAAEANKGMYGGLASQARFLEMATQLKPIYQEFNPSEVSRQAFELGIENANRARQFEESVDPAAARMRAGVSETVEKLTSPESWQQKLGQWAKTKGLAQMMGTGIDMGSTIGRSAMFDQATAQGRQIALEDLALRQKYLDATQNQGGIDPGALVAGQQAAKAQNLQGLQDWQRGVLSGAQGLGQTAQDAINRSMGNIQSAHSANVADTQNYNNMMNQVMAQNAQGKNAATGSWISAGGAVGGAALGAAIII